MKTRSLIIGIMFAGVLGVVLPRQAMAVTDEEFRALQQQMQQQSDQIQDLQKARQENKQEIQKLKDQLGVTQKTTDDTQKKVEETQKKVEETQQTVADTAAKVQPIRPVPSEGMLITHNVSLVGDAEVQFVKPEGQHGAFMFADFAPIFLFRAGDNVLFEAGFDIALHNNFDSTGGRQAGSGTSVDLSFATLDYMFNDYITLVAGDMVLPLGTYSERAAGWLNKIPDDPLPRSVLPGSGIGLQFRGAKAIGDSGQMVTYAIYGANGPSSTNGTGLASALDLDGNVGDTPNWHADPSAGGRIGWFYPWKAHYDLELGASGQSGTWDDAGKRLWSASVADAALHLSPYIEAKGEWIYTWV
jgi:type II secretory pathway pseudopilin PulG